MTLPVAAVREWGPDPRPTGGMRAILAETAAEYGLEPETLLAPIRKNIVVFPRQDFMWRCRQLRWEDGTHRYSLPKIAEFVGGMHHTSVLHGARQHAKRLLQAGARS
jgi:chromosomal replication initiation ATPase DnaA